MSTSPFIGKNGIELMAEIGKYPTLDTLLDRHLGTHPITDEEIKQQIARERAERALFHVKEQDRKAKKGGMVEVVSE